MMKVVYKRSEQRVEKTEDCILRTLAYFSVFEYPLTEEELHKFLDPMSASDCLDDALARLVAGRVVFKIDELYMLRDDSEMVARRKKGNLRALQLLPKARKIGRFLSMFPYVRGVGISGGLSKMYAHEKADFDFFIVTKANRLWIARTLMHIFKKLTFITGKQHHYCMNYYLDEKALQLQDRNMYTAIETITVLPVSGDGMKDFFSANSWVSDWFSEYSSVTRATELKKSSSWFKRIVEWLLNNKAGDRLDDLLMRLTTRRWKKKEEQRKLNYEGKEMALVTAKHFAWSNPDSFQEKIVGLYNKKLAELLDRPTGQDQSVNVSSAKK